MSAVPGAKAHLWRPALVPGALQPDEEALTPDKPIELDPARSHRLKGYEADQCDICRFTGSFRAVFDESASLDRENTQISSIVTLPRFKALKVESLALSGVSMMNTAELLIDAWKSDPLTKFRSDSVDHGKCTEPKVHCSGISPSKDGASLPAQLMGY